MKQLFIIFTLLFVTQGFAKKLKDYSPYKYEVYFTNPECGPYKYDEAVYSVDGTLLDGKPENVYCKRGDSARNQKRPSGPHYNLVKLIDDPKLESIFLTYLSFSNKDIAKHLCQAIEERNVAVTFIIDQGSAGRASSRKNLDYIANCKPKHVSTSNANIPQTYFRGKVGGLGYAHNKIIIAKYKNDKNKVKIVFSSGNMSSGTHLHHENWHFVTTSQKSHFAKMHECIKTGMLRYSEKKSVYQNFIKKCRSDISINEEEDIQVFVVPSEGVNAMNAITKAFENSKAIDVAAHRFTHPDIVANMVNAEKNGSEVRFVVDDDIYWAGKLGRTIGSNMRMEYYKMLEVLRAGTDVHYMETNQNSHFLHHNKYFIFHMPRGKGKVFAGAGNFTKAAFTKNFENFYMISIPSVYKKFTQQYNYVFGTLSTPYAKMPKTYVNP